jgi:hypothetical protein
MTSIIAVIAGVLLVLGLLAVVVVLLRNQLTDRSDEHFLR